MCEKDVRGFEVEHDIAGSWIEATFYSLTLGTDRDFIVYAFSFSGQVEGRGSPDTSSLSTMTMPSNHPGEQQWAWLGSGKRAATRDHTCAGVGELISEVIDGALQTLITSIQNIMDWRGCVVR